MSLIIHLNQVLVSQRQDLWLKNEIVKDLSSEYWAPIPLLSHSIQFGLVEYAKDVLTSDPGLVAKQPGRPLLDFALRRHFYEDQERLTDPDLCRPDVEIVRLILAQGGDPNEKLSGSTVWKLFLEYLDSFRGLLLRLSREDQQPWIDVTELLIKYGAARTFETETETSVPKQSMGQVQNGVRQELARTSLALAFGEAEATRLSSMAWWMNATGRNLTTKMTRNLRFFSVRSILGQAESSQVER